MEKWRDRLIEEGNEAAQGFHNEYPKADIQKLRQLIRNAGNKKNEKLALKSKRAIFQYVKEIITNNS
jgi:ribosome-associated protein